MMVREKVYAIFDYYDGPRLGVADFGGRPHAFRSDFDDAAEDWSEVYQLKPLSAAELEVVMTDWEIWLRWLEAHRAGNTGIETHPALPEDRDEHERIAAAVASALSIDPATARMAKAEFDAARWPPDGEMVVTWTDIEAPERRIP